MKARDWLASTVVLALAGVAVARTWDATWEAIPDGATALASDIDTFIKDLKLEIRFRDSVEQEWSTTGGGGDNGLMRVGSARAFIQNGAPTDIAGPGQFNNAGGGSYGSTTLNGTEIGGSDDTGRGRLWIDLDGPDGIAGTPDDRSLASWDETNDIFKFSGAVNPAATTLAAQRFLDAGKYNLLYNASFEVYDGVGGNNTSTTVPTGWVLSNATVMYTNNPTNTEGNGAQINVTSSAANGALQQTLASLKATTTYYAVARVKAGAGDSCDMVTTGAGTNLASTAVTSTSFTTTSGIFITDGTVTAVVLNLRSNGNPDTCAWDSVAVYELSADKRDLSSPGTVAVYDSDNTQSDVPVVRTAVPNLTASFIPPGPGWMVEVHAELAFRDSAASPADNAQCGLDNTGTDIAGTNKGTAITQGGVMGVASLSLSALVVNPTPGTMLTFTAECESTTTNVKYNGTQDGVALASNLWIVAHPGR